MRNVMKDANFVMIKEMKKIIVVYNVNLVINLFMT